MYKTAIIVQEGKCFLQEMVTSTSSSIYIQITYLGLANTLFVQLIIVLNYNRMPFEPIWYMD